MSCCTCCCATATTASETCILSSGTKPLASPGKQERRSSHTVNDDVSARPTAIIAKEDTFLELLEREERGQSRARLADDMRLAGGAVADAMQNEELSPLKKEEEEE